ncbi:hypothetical protein ANN_06969 [Periplaneta americana]|uniref:Uncharacterized protein n=1 Tax=Periplaneta americana TaxID=6978 RepID=A0ABQ8TEY9_PERAM|nr:hypothetical protein ANN_06969 [Periplaneta americana]
MAGKRLNRLSHAGGQQGCVDDGDKALNLENKDIVPVEASQNQEMKKNNEAKNMLRPTIHKKKTDKSICMEMSYVLRYIKIIQDKSSLSTTSAMMSSDTSKNSSDLGIALSSIIDIVLAFYARGCGFDPSRGRWHLSVFKCDRLIETTKSRLMLPSTAAELRLRTVMQEKKAEIESEFYGTDTISTATGQGRTTIYEAL